MPTADAANDAFDAFHARTRFGSLDGLRGLSVAAVIWHHTGGGLAAPGLAQQGHHGVTLFFAISGFLITTLLLRERERRHGIDLRAFYIRRTLRIFPLYYAVLLIYGVLVFVFERHSEAGEAFFSNLIYFATYTSNWFVAQGLHVIFYFSWSLAAEEQFYLVWPPLLKRLGTRARALAVIAAAMAGLVVIGWTLPRLVGQEAARSVQRGLDAVPLAILAGVAAALVLADRSGFARVWPWLAGSRWHSLLWLLIALGALSRPDAPRGALDLALTLLVVACCMREDHVLAGLLRLRPVLYLGTISYGLYLLHMLCKNGITGAARLVGIELGAGSLFVATLLLSIVVAGSSFRHFESRFLRIKGRFDRTALPVSPAA